MAYQSVNPYDRKILKTFEELTDVDKFARPVTFEMGKLIDEDRGEVVLSADIIDYYAKNAERFLAPKRSTGRKYPVRRALRRAALVRFAAPT